MAHYTSAVKSRMTMIHFYLDKATFNKKRLLLTSTLDLEMIQKTVKCFVWSRDMDPEDKRVEVS